MNRYSIGIALFLVSLGTLRGHDTWLLPGSFSLEPGKEITFDLTSGMDFPKLDHPIKAERVKESKLRLAGKAFDLKDPAGGETALRWTANLPAAGTATAWVTLSPRVIQLTEEKVQEYLDEIAAPEAVRKAWNDAGADRQWREEYIKNAKTFVVVGKADDSWKLPTGQPLEFVPLSDPTVLKPGVAFTVMLFRDGKPLAGQVVQSVGPDGKLIASKPTDAGGKATFTPKATGGPLLIRTTLLTPTKRPELDWESQFATLVLQAGGN